MIKINEAKAEITSPQIYILQRNILLTLDVIHIHTVSPQIQRRHYTVHLLSQV